MLKIIIKLILFLFLKYFFFSNKIEIKIQNRLIRFIKYNKRVKKNNGKEYNIKALKDYIDLIQSKKIKPISFKEMINKTKISFIAPVYNKKKYLRSLILSIQHQFLKEYEIIFIDDCSTDNSIKTINRFSKIDTRIKLIQNKKNKGTLYSRAQGALKSIGEYVIFIDSDDMILQEGLNNSYNYIKKKDLSLVQFNSIFRLNNSLILSKRYYKYENVIKQPILSYIFYFNEKTKRGDEQNTALWDKLIKKEIALKAVNFIGKDFYNENIKIENDVILLFSIFQVADSYQYINETGYYYIRTNNDSITNTWNLPQISNSIIHGVFANIKFLYNKTKNSTLDKAFCVFKLLQLYKRYTICFMNIDSEFLFIKNVLNLLLTSRYISNNDKLIISNIYSSLSLFFEAKKIK